MISTLLVVEITRQQESRAAVRSRGHGPNIFGERTGPPSIEGLDFSRSVKLNLSQEVDRQGMRFKLSAVHAEIVS